MFGLSSIKLYAIGAGILALITAAALWALQVRGLRAELAEARVATAQCQVSLEAERANVGRLEDAVARQNDAVTEMRRMAEATAATANARADGVLAAAQERRRAIEASRDAGPAEMNRWLADLLH